MTRVVLLGASNVTLGFGVLTRLIRAGFEGRLEVYGALGHGRSYGDWCSVGFRDLPAIVHCGIWEALAAAPPAPTYALLTDVGNDLMYGSPPDRILRWVEACLDRLCERGAHVVVTRLPIARVERLSPLRYHATRLTFFPFRQPIGWPEMLGRARELDAALAEAAGRRGAVVLTPPLEWYSFDPIHIRWTKRASAWSQVLAAWPGFHRPAGCLKAASLPIVGRMPEHYRLFGREGRTRQPVVMRPDATLSLF